MEKSNSKKLNFFSLSSRGSPKNSSKWSIDLNNRTYQEENSQIDSVHSQKNSTQYPSLYSPTTSYFNNKNSLTKLNFKQAEKLTIKQPSQHAYLDLKNSQPNNRLFFDRQPVIQGQSAPFLQQFLQSNKQIISQDYLGELRNAIQDLLWQNDEIERNYRLLEQQFEQSKMMLNFYQQSNQRLQGLYQHQVKEHLKERSKPAQQVVNGNQKEDLLQRGLSMKINTKIQVPTENIRFSNKSTYLKSMTKAVEEINQSENTQEDQRLNLNRPIKKQERKQQIRSQLTKEATYIPDKLQNNNREDDNQNKHMFNDERTKFIQHSSQFSSLIQLLSLDADKDTSKKIHSESKEVQFMSEMVRDKASFYEYIENQENHESIFESMFYVLNHTEIYIEVIDQLKEVLNSFQSMSSSYTIEDCFQNIIQFTCRILNCDRASVFLVDYQQKQLWTKVAQGSSTVIRIPFGSGLAGHVAITGEILNILDAHADDRFNREFDIKTKYRTKTVLTAPIKNNDGQTIAVIQAINQQTEDGFFTKDDEGIISIMGTLSQVTINNTLYLDQKLSVQNSLRHLFNAAIQLNMCTTIKDFLIKAEQEIQRAFDIHPCKIFAYNQEGKQLFRYSDNGVKEEFSENSGLTGHCFQRGKVVEILNGYQHVEYVQGIDIKSQLPLLFVPVYSPQNEDDDMNDENSKSIKLGIIVTINPRGIEVIANSNNRSNQNQFISNSNQNTVQDTIVNFSHIMGQTLYIKRQVNQRMKRFTINQGPRQNMDILIQ